MRKLFTFFVASVLAASAMAADDNFTYSWNHTIDGLPSAGDNVLSTARSSDGKVFTLSQFCSGSSTASVASGYRNAPDISNFLNLFIDGEKAVDDAGNEIIGNDYKTSDGNSTAENALLQKIDPETGKILWNVWTDRGECYSSNSHVLATADGGAVLVMYYRQWGQAKGDTLIHINGTNGTSGTIATTEGTWYKDGDTQMHIVYMPVFVKLDADGRIVSTKLLWHPAPQKDLQYNPGWLSFVSGVTSDGDGNIYVCGNFRTTLTFDNGETITAKNVTGWTGDDQSTIGDLYLIKLDKNGNYVKNFTASGTANVSYLRHMAFTNGKIYAAGYVQGDGTALTFGSTSLTFPDTGQSLLLAAFDTDLNPVFAKGWKADSKISALHQEALQVYDGNLYLTGSVYSRNGGGTISEMDGSATILAPTLKTHQGYIAEFSPEDGSFIASGLISKTSGISKIYGLFRTLENGKYYLNGWGYDMTNGGANIYKFDATPDADKKLENTDYTNVVNRGQGFAAVQHVPVTFDKRVVLVSRFGRANNANQTFKLLGDVTTAAVNCWAVVEMSYTNPYIVDDDGAAAGIRSIKADNRKGQVSSHVYTISGQYVGESLSNLPAGLYIQNGRKVVVR